MKIFLHQFDKQLEGTVQLTSSKSESNRALLINALSGDKLTLKNLSDARDTQTMLRLLQEPDKHWDVLDAGTTMRFCTAYLAVTGNGHTITGTDRMKQRPIGLLAEALKELGADIQYLEKEGFPPLKISKITEQKSHQIEIPGNISSQFISALLMIGPRLPQGIELKLTTEVFSRPYIEMTLGLMELFGVKHSWKDAIISIPHQSYWEGHYTIESDWSGASYWYSMAAISKGGKVKLLGLREKSLQGDQEITNIMKRMGVNTHYDTRGAQLIKTAKKDNVINIDFRTCPDLAQTVMVAAAAKGITLKMTGLESLRIKETDRIAAMQNELAKIGTRLIEEESTWTLIPGELPEKGPVTIETYEDHRMAMAFAPLCQLMDIEIKDPDVVNKSYPAFWEDLKSVGVMMKG